MLRRAAGLSLLTLVLPLGAAVLVAPASPTEAAPGDVLRRVVLATPCPLSEGLAYDGVDLWYTCAFGSPDLIRASASTGATLAQYTVANGLGGLTWDATHRRLLALAPPPSEEGPDVVYTIDPATGSGAPLFELSSPAGGDGRGIAHDPESDTILISRGSGPTIDRYRPNGELVNSFAPAAECSSASAIAVGGSLLFLVDGCGEEFPNGIRARDKETHQQIFRLEAADITPDSTDLECDASTFAPRSAIWALRGEAVGTPALRRAAGGAANRPRAAAAQASVTPGSSQEAIAYQLPDGACAGTQDSDSDGLLDVWETRGLTNDPDDGGPLPAQFIDLPAMGADPAKPDIFVHLDWMEDSEHTHRLSQAAIQRVVQAFADSPYVVPLTGSVGISLHVDQGPTSILDFATGAPWGALSRARAWPHVTTLGTTTSGRYDWSAFDNLKKQSFIPTGRAAAFHYALAVHFHSGTASGISRDVPASDFIISLGAFPAGCTGAACVGTELEQAGTLMHELGHNLGLRHGGGDDINYKPNYFSVMNYAFQLRGIIRDGVEGVLDFSRSAQPTFVERPVVEAVGLGPTAQGFGTRHFCAGLGYVSVPEASVAIDWNCDGDTLDANIFVNVNGQGGLVAQTLVGFDDWSRIRFTGGGIGDLGESAPLPDETEVNDITPAENQRILSLPLNSDPLLIIPPAAEMVSRPFSAIPDTAQRIKVVNGDPGVRHLRLEVNGQVFDVLGLRDGDQRTVDVGAAMVPGANNTVVATAFGESGSRVYVLIGN